MTIQELKKLMREHAKKCGEQVPPMLPNNTWGRNARKLAWRITYKHLDNPSTQPGPVKNFLRPPHTRHRANILEIHYDFHGAPTVRSGPPKGIVWHHAAGWGSPQAIHSYHKSIGDKGIGYHFYVTRGGNIYRGRPENTYGAHCLNHNDWIGVCAEGNYEAKDDMPPAQLAALKSLHHYLHDKYKVVDKKHREMSGNSTACPGKYFPFDKVISSK